MRRFVGLLFVVLALAGVVWAQGALLINGTGATFPYPIYSKWFDEYHKKFGNIQINYQSLGSGAGIKQVTEGTVDFGASDGPMNPDQLKAYSDKHGSGILHFPTVLGAAVPIYNIPGVTTSLNFTPEALAGIFLGRITKWNDPIIAAANSSVKLPASDIVVIHRSEGSGTTYIWTDYLSKVSPDWKNKVGTGASINWPAGLGGKGSEGVSGLIKQRGADQDRLWQREELFRRVYQGGLQQRQRRSRRCRQDHARRFPRLHHRCSRQNRLPDFQLHLAADSREIYGHRETRRFERFYQVGAHRWPILRGESVVRQTPQGSSGQGTESHRQDSVTAVWVRHNKAEQQVTG